jgi:hypothetical protein
MKTTILLILISSFFIGCNDDKASISREEYTVFVPSTPDLEWPISIKNSGRICYVTLIEIKNHEYLYAETVQSHGGISLCHYPECRYCKLDTLNKQ